MVKTSPISAGIAVLCGFLILYSSYSYSQIKGENGTQSIALSGADLFLTSVWSMNSNPALLSKSNGIALASSYVNHFMIAELASKNLVASFANPKNGYGLSFSQFGFHDYSENKLAISYSRSFSDHFSMGIQGNRLSTVISEPYGSSSSFSINLGIYSKISDQISLAAQLINPSSSTKDQEKKEPYPQSLRFGIEYRAISYLRFIGVIMKEHFYPLRLSVGLEYEKNEQFLMNLGFSNHINQFSFGINHQFKQLNFGIASSYNHQLGFSPAIEVGYLFDSKDQQRIKRTDENKDQ